jgi:ABC-type Fe3+-hydroxamate transport system substrate-binding protein
MRVPPRLSRRSTLILLAAPVLALAAGCGSASSSSGSPAAGVSASTVSSAAFPVTVSGAAGPVTLSSAPKRIVSLSPSGTEMLFAIGAGPQVIAVDDQSTYPANAPRTKLSSYQPNAEAVAKYQPDLVVISNDANGLVATLKNLQIPVLAQPAPSNLDGSYAEELALGRATGHQQQAQQVVASTKQRIAAAIASVPRPAKPLKIYHELDPTYYSVTSGTFIGSIYTLFGLQDIADKAKTAVSSGGYPQLSAEYVVSAAPDVIVLADSRCCGQTPAKVGARPAFSTLPAVKDGRVIAVSDDIASRWGPRVADFAEAVAKGLGG